MAITSFPNSPFYDPSWTYPQTNPLQPTTGTPLGWVTGEQNPGDPWTARLAALGFGGLDNKGMWAQQLYNRARSGYGAAAQQAFNQKRGPLQWQDYLQSLDLQRMWEGLGPGEKGYTDTQFGGPPRWQRRP